MTAPGRNGRAARTAAAVEHPEWCDSARCSGAATARAGEAHRSAPATIKARAGLTDPAVTASLYQAHTAWLTEVFVILDVAGLDHDFRPVDGTATLGVDQAADLGAMLTGIAEQGAAWQNQQISEHLATLRRGVRT